MSLPPGTEIRNGRVVDRLTGAPVRAPAPRAAPGSTIAAGATSAAVCPHCGRSIAAAAAPGGAGSLSIHLPGGRVIVADIRGPLGSAGGLEAAPSLAGGGDDDEGGGGEMMYFTSGPVRLAPAAPPFTSDGAPDDLIQAHAAGGAEAPEALTPEEGAERE